MNWNEYFINIAKAVALKSKDPSSKVGCVIVSEDNRPLSFGFNGWVQGCDESYMTNERPMKYNLVIHAEMNAILMAKQSLKGAKLYCTHAPCENCLKHIMQAGIKEVVFDDYTMLSRFSEDQKGALCRLLSSNDNFKCEDVVGEKYISLIIEEIVK